MFISPAFTLFSGIGSAVSAALLADRSSAAHLKFDTCGNSPCVRKDADVFGTL